MRFLVVAALILLAPGAEALSLQLLPPGGGLVPCLPVGAGVDDEAPFVHPIVAHECLGGSPNEEEAAASAAENETVEGNE